MAAGRDAGKGKRSRVVKKKAPSQRAFYILIGIVIILGGVWLATQVSKPKTSAVSDVGITAAQAEGYLLGNPNAPVQVREFADFECPACGQFANVTEPDIRRRLVESGQVSYRYFDFPLPQHNNTMLASSAAACAADQNKFWEMHDALFFNQPEWSSQATSNPLKFFPDYAQQVGLNMEAWKKCVSDDFHHARIVANRKEGERLGVGQTPTFIIGTKKLAGALTYDEFKGWVDSAAAKAGSKP
jgi:protein-disulfide isomerase